MALTKKAYTPSEGIYYVVPRKDGHVTVLSQRADEAEDPTHMFFWGDVLVKLSMEYGKDLSDITTNYLGLPRGRVQEELTRVVNTTKFMKTGRYVVLHGDDVPVSTIRYAILQDFGLGELESQKKVVWKVEPHEKMDPSDSMAVQRALQK